MKRRLLVPLLLGGCLLAATARAEETVATWYVSPQGNDAWSGQLDAPNAEKTDGPLGTLQQAVTASRQVAAGPRRIAILPGEYAVDKTIELTDADAGPDVRGPGRPAATDFTADGP